MTHEIDMAVLAHARTFPPTAYTGKSMYSIHMACGSVAEVQHREALDRLAKAGLVEPTGEPWQVLRRTAQAYQITAAGRAAVREHFNIEELTVDVARGMHSSELARVYGDLPLAQSQLELRRAANGIVRAALKSLGYEYSGTGGWHIVACVTESRLGFVNIAHGIAVETDVSLDSELVEAVTVPDQGTGVKASGAAAWTSPDAGIVQLADDGTLCAPAKFQGAPEGWTQLLVDVRSDAGDATAVELTNISARVVMWGLRTCYGEPGAPGYTTLDGRDRLPMHAWPTENHEVRHVMRRYGSKWLDSVARKLAALAGCVDGVTAALDGDRNIGDAIESTGAYTYSIEGYTATAAARSACDCTRNVIRDALRDAGVGRISAACDITETVGGRYYDLIAHCLRRAVVERLTPVAEALWEQMAPLVGGREDGWSMSCRITPVLERLASELATDLLRGVADEASSTEDAIVKEYYLNGPVEVNLIY
jgi:hypothetical protein